MSHPQHDNLSGNANHSLATKPWDLLVIGGGIVGAGVARDAALRGLRTLLVEQDDFASGTSSRSSRLLHGGLRYLAQGRIGLVREASREKRILAEIAPHLAEPLAFIFPTRRATPWSFWKLSLGVKLYDALCGMKNFGKSQSLSHAATKRLLPSICDEGLTGAVRYFDALTNDARMVIDTLRSAAANGAEVRNYTRFAGAERDGDAWLCTLSTEAADQEVEVRAGAVVNATGPWSDQLPHSSTSLRLTKGVHLVVDREKLPVPDAVVMAEGERILFAIPWGERVILGTTDTDYYGAIEEPTCDEADTRYVLDVVNASFPNARLTESDVVGHWAGLRPLVADPNGNPSDISRRHEISMSSPGWWDVTGGKLTTHRLMAEETVDAIVRHLQRTVQPCRTARTPLLPGDEPDPVSGILPPPVCELVVEHCCRNEWTQHLDDLMIRRTSWQHYHRNHSEVAQRVAGWMSRTLGWDDERLASELDSYTRISRVEHSLELEGTGVQ